MRNTLPGLQQGHKAATAAFLIERKGGWHMGCAHDKIRCTNGVKYCLACGCELPRDYLPGKPAQAAIQPEKAEKTATKRTSRKGAK